MAKIRYDKQKGFRIKRGFICVVADDWWYSMKYKQWIPHYVAFDSTEKYWRDAELTNAAPCRTIRAFRRMLRKHPQLVGRAILISRYKGYDAYA
jgi:hypothetical protein